MIRHKTWNKTRWEIENLLVSTVHDATDGEVLIESGLQLLKTISHSPSPIFGSTFCSVTKNGMEKYLVSYLATDCGQNIIAEWICKPSEGRMRLVKKTSIRNCLKKLIWIPSQHAFVGYCDDMTIRGYRGDTLEEKVKVSIPSSAVCMIYLEDYDEMITAGQGNLISWRIRMIEFGRPFELKEPPIECDVNDCSDIWVNKLNYDKGTRTLFVVTESAIFIIDMETRKQTNKIRNTHFTSLTHCAYFDRFFYLITAARDGTIHVYHTVAEALVHKFSGHRDGVTGVACLPTNPVLISWSHTSGSLRMWRLDTLELANETSLSENIVMLSIPRPNRLIYQTESELRIFDINVVYSVFATLSAPAQTFKICPVRKITRTEDNKNIYRKKIMPLLNIKHHHYETHHRLMCVLDDRSILSLSPISGCVLSICFPLAERDNTVVDLDLKYSGSECTVVLSGGDIAEYDFTVNPGNLDLITTLESNKPVPLCVAALELKLPCAPDGEILTCGTDIEHFSFIKFFNVVMLGFMNGFVRIYKQSPADNNEDEMSVVMAPVKVHSGEVLNLFSPSYECLKVRAKTCISNHLINCLVTTGNDCSTRIWNITYEINIFNKIELILIPIGLVKWKEVPTVMTVVSSVMFIGHTDGDITMHKMHWEDCDEIALSSIRSSEIDKDLKHSGAVTSADNSIALRLVVTCSGKDPIKIWDIYGQIVREINLGDPVTCACFACGRDLLASLRNHIVRIECTDYLPKNKLKYLLKLGKAKKIKDNDPEEPIPMDDNAEGMVCILTPEDRMMGVIAKAQKQARLESLAKEEAQRKAEEERVARIKLATMKAKATARELARASMRSKIRKNMTAVQAMGRFGFAISRMDSVAAAEEPKPDLNVGEGGQYDMKLMSRTPIAADGYVPNSVIRNLVKSIYPGITMKEILKGRGFINHTTSEYQSSEPSTQYTFGTSEVKLFSNSDERLLRENKLRLMEWETQYREGKIFEFSDDETLEDYCIDDLFNDLERSESIDSDIEVMLSGIFEKFDSLAGTTSKSTIHTFSNALNKILSNMDNMTEMEILELLNMISTLQETLVTMVEDDDKSTEMYQRFKNGIPISTQKQLADRLGKLLNYDWTQIRFAAASLLAKLNVEFIAKVVMHNVMPEYLPKSQVSKNMVKWKHYGIIKLTGEYLSALVKNMSERKIHQLRKVINPTKDDFPRIGRDAAVKAVEISLRRFDIEKHIAEIFGQFIIPLLPRKADAAKRKVAHHKNDADPRYLSSIVSFHHSVTETSHDEMKIQFQRKKPPPVISILNFPENQSEFQDSIPTSNESIKYFRSDVSLPSSEFPFSKQCQMNEGEGWSQVTLCQDSKELLIDPHSSSHLAGHSNPRGSKEAIKIFHKNKRKGKHTEVGEVNERTHTGQHKAPALSTGIVDGKQITCEEDSNTEPPSEFQVKCRRRHRFPENITTNVECRKSSSTGDLCFPRMNANVCERDTIARSFSVPTCEPQGENAILDLITKKDELESISKFENGDWRMILSELRKRRLRDSYTESVLKLNPESYCHNTDSRTSRHQVKNTTSRNSKKVCSVDIFGPSSPWGKTKRTAPAPSSRMTQTTAFARLNSTNATKLPFPKNVQPVLKCDRMQLQKLPWKQKDKLGQFFDRLYEDDPALPMPQVRHQRVMTNSPSCYTDVKHQNTCSSLRYRYEWSQTPLASYAR